MSRKKRRNLYIILGILAIILAILIINTSSSSKEKTSQELGVFAECLTENGAVLYGAYWCPHCLRTKEAFGDSFEYIHYVECDPRGENEQSMLCIEKNIRSYPTWEFNEDPSTRLYGELTFEELSEKTGCEVPAGL